MVYLSPSQCLLGALPQNQTFPRPYSISAKAAQTLLFLPNHDFFCWCRGKAHPPSFISWFLPYRALLRYSLGWHTLETIRDTGTELLKLFLKWTSFPSKQWQGMRRVMECTLWDGRREETGFFWGLLWAVLSRTWTLDMRWTKLKHLPLPTSTLSVEISRILFQFSSSVATQFCTGDQLVTWAGRFLESKTSQGTGYSRVTPNTGTNI